MRVGSIVFATDQGLGILAKSFYDHGVVTDAVVIRHGTHETHKDWYPGAMILGDIRSRNGIAEMERFCKSVDVMLFFETPFHWPLIDYCRQHGIKTVLMPMYECFPTSGWQHKPDLYLCPSHLDYEVFKDKGDAVHIPVPVEYPWKLRTRAEVFVHNAGHGGLRGRNGTSELLEAARLVTCPAKFIVRMQVPHGFSRIPTPSGGYVEMRHGTASYDQLFAEGDVFIFPEKFNGLSLPLQEARASGMLVVCGDRFPMNQWLPREPLIPVAGTNKNRIGPAYLEFDEAVFSPKTIAAKIDEWYDKDITGYSESGREWAAANSWDVLGPQYRKTLGEL